MTSFFLHLTGMDYVTSPTCCTRDQLKTYQLWVSIADSDGDGRVTGKDALKFFAMSNLPRPELKQVWTFADSKRQGFLDFEEFVSAMQLISLAQGGLEITQDCLPRTDLQKLQLPEMQGLDILIAIQKEFRLPAGDFPNVDQFKEILSSYNLDKFEKLMPKMIQAVDDMLGYDIPELLKSFRNPYD